MSNALMCDKCFKCFNPLTVSSIRISIPEMIVADDISTRDKKVLQRFLNLDLCPKCSEELYVWWWGQKVYRHTVEELYGKEPEEYEDWKTEIKETEANGDQTE